MNRGSAATAPVTLKIYSGLGGTGSILYTTNIVATVFSTAGYVSATIAVPDVNLGNTGGYSVQLYSTQTQKGNDTYLFKGGPTALTTNGVPISGLYWSQDSTANGTAGTSFNATDVLADYHLSATNILFNNYRINSTISTSVTLQNSAMSTTNNATEMLGTTATATNSRATLSGLTTGLLADKTNTSFTVGFTTASVGTNTGSITFSFTSSTNGTAAVRTPGGVTNIATQVLSVSGVGYRLAADGLSATNINFGNYRINSTLSSSIGLTNTAANDGYSEKLSISTNSVSASLTISGVPTSLMAAQSNTNVVVGLNSASVGTNNAAFTLSFA